MIPRLLHMQYFWQTPVAWMFDNICEWRDANPDWELVFWDHEPEDLPEWIRDVLPLAPTPRFRADIIRYWTIYKHGGIYVDIDTRPISGRNLDDLLAAVGAGCTGFYSCYRSPELPDNFFIGGVPDSPWWLRATELAASPDDWRRPNRFFGSINAYADLVKTWKGMQKLPSNFVIEIEDVSEYDEFRNRKPLNHPTAYMKHYRTCGRKSLKLLGGYDETQWEENGLRDSKGKFVRRRKKPRKPVAPAPPPPTPVEMPSGDLVVAPSQASLVPVPDGYERDEKEPWRFHKKIETSQSKES